MRNAISSDSESESDQNIMPEKGSDGNIMPEKSSDGNIMLSTSGNEEKAAEKQGNMPLDNSAHSGGSPEGADAGAADIDLERIMEAAESDDANDSKENSNDKSHSQSNSTSSSSASSNDDNSSDEQSSSKDTEYICGTATCGKVYPSAAAL